ncbi:MAG: RdgB/HAM1 family non-canonical purine NTP pyrophosphatase [Leptonema sp. (in: Bacteria)]|nr:RdgB/HAM1 family non-canonical purine NTP pyrophosphatase [Leptonema sp. (in: bacteria)]
MRIPELRKKGILIATNNSHKVRELEQLLFEFAIPIITPQQLGISIEVDETGATFIENAILKMKAFADRTDLPTLADDSGLVVDALDGRPGVFSARYGGKGLSDADRVNKLLDELVSVASHRRQARFVCSIAFCFSDNEPIRTYEGVVEGRILLQPEGQGGFGYDPVFEDMITGQSFASLSEVEKNQRSHRGRALKQFLNDLQRS